MKTDTTTKTPDHKIEVKNVKHEFTQDERNQIGGDLARSIGEMRGIEGEFDQVKASFKARITEKESRIDALSTNLVNGFDYRNERCVVLFNRGNGEKTYYLESRWIEWLAEKGVPSPMGNPVLIEKMTQDDFQTELLQAEAKFEHRCVLDIFPAAGEDRGELIVGKFGARWFSALRIKVGKSTLEERLDSEQRSWKTRTDAVSRAGKRASEWFKETFKDEAKGFEEPLAKMLAEQAEREE